MESKNILAISSLVVHGYVGNRASSFPLQYLGWNVDSLNTTNFSNHPGYGKIKGDASSQKEIEVIFQGLEDILDVSHCYNMILTGYTPSDECLEGVFKKISQIMSHIPASSKRTRWLVDPVLGDNGKLYVKEDVIPIYKKMLGSGLVSLTTPNQFEFELLSETKISDWSSLKEAFKRFIELFSIPNIVLTSVFIEDQMYSVGYAKNKKEMLFAVPVERIPCDFSGSGDLFMALLANSYYNNSYSISPAVLQEVLFRLHGILRYTYEKRVEEAKAPVRSIKTIDLIGSRHILSQSVPSSSENSIIYL